MIIPNLITFLHTSKNALSLSPGQKVSVIGLMHALTYPLCTHGLCVGAAGAARRLLSFSAQVRGEEPLFAGGACMLGLSMLLEPWLLYKALNREDRIGDGC